MKRRLRIAQVAPLWYPVPPPAYGGTELVVSQLTEELVRRGHQVTLYASGDSRTKARKVSVTKKCLTAGGIPWTSPGFNLLNLEKAFSEAKKYDLIHTHIDPFDGFFRSLTDVPSVATLHNHFWAFDEKNRARFADREATYTRFRRQPLVAISNAYRRFCPLKLNFAATIWHGVELDKFRFNDRPDDHFVWLGRIARIKGLHSAVAACRRAGAKLTIAGPFITKEGKEYFDREIRPHVDGRRIRYVGEKNSREKAKLLRSARAMLYPIEWNEPFGITMVEAMACGTPVIAFDRGSAGEVVEHGRTGFIVRGVGQMVAAMRRIGEIDRRSCRKRVERHFTIQHMADKYEKVYRSLLN